MTQSNPFHVLVDILDLTIKSMKQEEATREQVEDIFKNLMKVIYE